VRRSLVREIAEVVQQENRTDLVKRDLVERIDGALHGLCQPLTVLQCRLAMGELIDEPDAMREAIREALQECVRMNRTVGMMRAMLQQVMSDMDDERKR
jgi:signal transduction histidine kinase